MKIILPSYAKVNLFLKVDGLRKDGFHSIKTIYERISLNDRVTLAERSDKQIRVATNNPELPGDSSNLAYRAAALMQDRLAVSSGVDIKIIKNIPLGSGMGGGSSNAASVLVGLNKIWKTRLSVNELAKLGARLGSDVPFFIYNTSFAQGSGRGEKIIPLRGLEKAKLWHILVIPRINVSTRSIYQAWDIRKKGIKPRLTKARCDVRIPHRFLSNKIRCRSFGFLENDLEDITSSFYPEVAFIKRKLSDSGVQAVLMSGSGPTVFGIVSSKGAAATLYRQLRRINGAWRLFIASTI